jgi:hypothetical protein
LRSAFSFHDRSGGAVLLTLQIPIHPRKATKVLFFVPWFLLLYSTGGLSQGHKKDDGSLPKYALSTETKTKGVVEDIKLLPLDAGKDFTVLVVKSGDDTVQIYVCPKTFQEEVGISFGKGDEISVTGSKVKQEASDVILARELVRGTDTLVLRDEKGKPVWDPRTGK